MRGKARVPAALKVQHRITPAYAGKSSVNLDSRNTISGSPPPMRGKAVNAYITFLHVGITPAYAGKSPERVSINDIKAGSPPPMRGKVPIIVS